MRRIIALLVVPLIASVGLAITAVSADAKSVENDTGHVDEVIPDDEICGIETSTHVVSSAPFHLKQVGGQLYFNSTGHQVITFTVPDGRWVRYSYSGPAHDSKVTDLGHDMLLVKRSINGRGLSLTATNGDTLRSVGNLVREIVIDDNGTPLNPDDDTILDETIVKATRQIVEDPDFCGFLEDHLT